MILHPDILSSGQRAILGEAGTRGRADRKLPSDRHTAARNPNTPRVSEEHSGSDQGIYNSIPWSRPA